MNNELPKLLASFASSICQVLIFNPWDKAAYLAIKHKRGILVRDNWKRPYKGILNTMIVRSFSGGAYFYLLDACEKTFNSTIVAGNITGIIMTFATNPLNYVRYQTWGNANRKYIATAKEVMNNGGIFKFYRGSLSRMHRDIVFNCIFLTSHHYWRDIFKEHKNGIIFGDLITTTFGTIICSPFNYIMNRKYIAGPKDDWKTSFGVLKSLWESTKTEDKKFRFLIKRFMIGPGTLRAGLGMTLGIHLYEFFIGYTI